MITLRELFKVMHTITRVEIAARAENTVLLHSFWIGKGCDRAHLPKGMVPEWSKGRLSLSSRRINEHGKANKRGLPEIGWGLERGSIPDELLDAEITHLGGRCADGIEYKLSIDVILPEIIVEVLKGDFDDDKEGNQCNSKSKPTQMVSRPLGPA